MCDYLDAELPCLVSHGWLSSMRGDIFTTCQNRITLNTHPILELKATQAGQIRSDLLRPYPFVIQGCDRDSGSLGGTDGNSQLVKLLGVIGIGLGTR